MSSLSDGAGSSASSVVLGSSPALGTSVERWMYSGSTSVDAKLADSVGDRVGREETDVANTRQSSPTNWTEKQYDLEGGTWCPVGQPQLPITQCPTYILSYKSYFLACSLRLSFGFIIKILLPTSDWHALVTISATCLPLTLMSSGCDALYCRY